MSSLLPPSSTPQERALEGATARLGELDVPIRKLWNADDCPLELLPWLAWAFGVDEWDDAWSEAVKRATVRESIMIQRRKGSVWSIRRIFLLLGLGEIEIQEGRGGKRRDGTMVRDGFAMRGTRAVGWAHYRIYCKNLLPVKLAELARTLLKNTAPARCHLVEINFKDAALVRNGYARRDGTYTRGIV